MFTLCGCNFSIVHVETIYEYALGYCGVCGYDFDDVCVVFDFNDVLYV